MLILRRYNSHRGLAPQTRCRSSGCRTVCRADATNDKSVQESVMKARTLVSALVATGLLCASTLASAYDADWKRGRIYYRSVCTACHANQAGGSIAPSTMTKA